MKHLPSSFYKNSNVIDVAYSLIGKIIRTNIDGLETSGRIIETEAYRGEDDKGCHSFQHGRTLRTEAMFEEGGIAYVYICYGIHNMVNVVTNLKDKADAVLIRAIEPIKGIDTMLKRRGGSFKNYHLSGGPGKVCQCLGISSHHNKVGFSSLSSPVQILDDGYKVQNIHSTPRVGMSIRVEDYSNKPWRFYEQDNPYVSRPLQLHYPWDK